MRLLVIVFMVIFILYRLRNRSIFSEIKHFVLIIIVFFLVINIIKYPQQSFDAAKLGVDTWFNIVFPALLPFFIGAELLIGLGVVNFLGILLEPIIRPLFNVSGEGAFVLAMSITSGYPIGVKLITQLRNQERFDKFEAQRLLSFCSTSGPLFMISAVSIGMFHNPQLGTVITISHYLGAIATGILFRFYKFKYKNSLSNNIKKRYLKRAFQEMFQTTQSNEKTFGALLGSAVKNSVETLFVIGGFIVLFSVVIKILTTIGIIHIISFFFQNILSIFHFQASTGGALISGIFEITMGCKLLSETPGIPFIEQAVLATIIISWSGLSIHAQSASLISKTDLNTGIYIFSKFIHSIFSGFFVLIIVPVTHTMFNHINTPVFLNQSSKLVNFTWTSKILFSSKLFLSMTIFIAIVAILFQTLFLGIWSVKNTRKKK
ncbi:sporulation integral membrane protein YlbJ [Marinisporobacter balticus]|uniref:Sporulation integral membrane protein YlbJ n=1 Tax=Marinisporobacter balticus TaxID=2018667 RepID=A0A4R2LI54_9FIRM|nr:sporulation integral membrane protein YlbJ [Marinisporobacter balticus]TCO78995.1 sporulation integral membrane protein YlbJ [Marinisporobacter balticus]